MTPTTHPSNNHSFGPPEGMTEEQCSTVRATVAMDNGNPVIFTFWKPDEDELRMLLEGKAVAVGFYGGSCPVHSVGIAT